MKQAIRKSKAFSIIGLLLCPILTFYLSEGFTHNVFQTMGFTEQLINWVIYGIIGFLLWAICRKLSVAMMAETGIFFIYGLANYYVLRFRSAPIQPWDIFSLRTAATVAGDFNYQLELEPLIIIVLFIGLFVAEAFLPGAFQRRSFGRGLCFMLSALLLWGGVSLIQRDSFVKSLRLYDKLFTPTVMSNRNGTLVAFIMESKYIGVDIPAGYDAEEMIAVYDRLTLATKADVQGGSQPNIIVIMNEAFSDLSVLGEFTTNQPVMPFLDSLKGADNTITGNLHVSVLGGNTANTEFEFLTGISLGFFPQGSVPYQQYVVNPVPTIASMLHEQGYETIAIHPYYRTGWERDQVYPKLGFEEFLDIQAFKRGSLVRKYISDDTCYQKIIELYEGKQANKPLFVFNVTMQNHSGYDKDFENLEVDVLATEYQNQPLNRYLTLVNKSDQALEELIEYFAQVEEDTIIVFFGDHQPASYLSRQIFAQGMKDSGMSSEERNDLLYKVPYVIWANYPIQGKSEHDLSANYLAAEALSAAGIQTEGIFQYIQELQKKEPVFSAIVKPELDKREVNLYHRLAYYLMFDYQEEGMESDGSSD